ncbi:MAG: hypothetical protein HDT28_02125 [Clostridiales bacterium]|nr:hypothetical protein [Clostridiales bacterium]
MRVATKKLTTAAVCTALAVIMCTLTAYLPLSFMPLYLAAFCIFLACKRGSVAYGVLCALASIGLMFLMTGLSVKWLTFVIMFAPYGIVTVFLHKFDYRKPKTAIIRALITIAYFNATFGALYAIVVNVATVGIDINIAEWANRVGGYAVLAVIATVVLVPLDFIFCVTAATVLKKIPAPVTRREADNKKPEQPAPDTQTKKYDDVFGYEIIEKQDEQNKDNTQ